MARVRWMDLPGLPSLPVLSGWVEDPPGWHDGRHCCRGSDAGVTVELDDYSEPIDCARLNSVAEAMRRVVDVDDCRLADLGERVAVCVEGRKGAVRLVTYLTQVSLEHEAIVSYSMSSRASGALRTALRGLDRGAIGYPEVLSSPKTLSDGRLVLSPIPVNGDWGGIDSAGRWTAFPDSGVCRLSVSGALVACEREARAGIAESVAIEQIGYCGRVSQAWLREYCAAFRKSRPDLKIERAGMVSPCVVRGWGACVIGTSTAEEQYHLVVTDELFRTWSIRYLYRSDNAGAWRARIEELFSGFRD